MRDVLVTNNLHCLDDFALAISDNLANQNTFRFAAGIDVSTIRGRVDQAQLVERRTRPLRDTSRTPQRDQRAASIPDPPGVSRSRSPDHRRSVMARYRPL